MAGMQRLPAAARECTRTIGETAQFCNALEKCCSLAFLTLSKGTINTTWSAQNVRLTLISICEQCCCLPAPSFGVSSLPHGALPVFSRPVLGPSRSE